MQSWLEGRYWVRKCVQATGMTASLRILSSKADSNTWESFTRNELKLESVDQESPRSDIFRKSATKPLLKQRQRQKHLTWAKEKKNWTVAQWSRVLFSDESKFCISFRKKGPRVWRKSGETHNPCFLKSSVKFPQSLMILGCHVICWCWPTVFSEVHSQHSHLPGHFRAPHASFCWKNYMEMLISFSSRTWHPPTLPKVPKAGSMTMVLLCLIDQQTRLTWTPYIIYGLLSRGRWETPDPTMQMTRRPKHPFHLSSATGSLPPCHAALMQ